MKQTSSEKNDWVFDEESCPQALKGVIKGITYKKDPIVNEYYQPRSGEITIKVAPGIDSVNMSFGVVMDNAYVIVKDKKVIKDAITVSTEENSTQTKNVILEEYEITGRAVPQVYSSETGRNLYVEAGGSVTSQMAYFRTSYASVNGSMSEVEKVYDHLEYVLKIDKNAGIQGISFPSTSPLNNSNTKYSVDTTRDPKNDYLTIKLEKNAPLKASQFKYEFRPPANAKVGNYTFTLDSSKYKLNGEDDYVEGFGNLFSSCNVIVVPPYKNSLTSGQALHSFYGYDSNEKGFSALGSIHVANEQARALTNQRIKADFSDPALLVTMVRLPLGAGGAAKDIVIKTNKGNTFNLASRQSRQDGTDKFGRFYLNIAEFGVTNPDESITEVIYNADGDISVGADSTLYGFRSATDGNNPPFTYFGKLKYKPVSGSFSATITSVEQGKDFSDASASSGTGVMTIKNATTTTFAVTNTLPTHLSAGETTTVKVGVTKAPHKYDSQHGVPGTITGYEFYIRETADMKVDSDNIKVSWGSKVYSAANGTLTAQKTTDNTGAVIYKVKMADITLGDYEKVVGAGYASYPSMDVTYPVTIVKNASKKSIAHNELFMVKALNYKVASDNGSKSIENTPNKFNVDGSNDTSKLMGSGTISNSLNITPDPTFVATTAANLDGGDWTTYDYATGKDTLRVDHTSKLRYQLNAANNSGEKVTGYTALVPIPKAGEKTSLTPNTPAQFSADTHIQKEAFGWTANLMQEVKPNSLLNYDVKYSESYDIDKDSASFKPWGQIVNKNNIRMVKITTTDGIDDSVQDSIDFALDIDQATAEANNGKVNTYSSRVYRSVKGTAGYKPSEPVSMRLSTGAVEGRVFIDTNGNGKFDAGEQGRSGVKVNAYKKGTTTLVKTTTTAASGLEEGLYKFSSLDADVPLDLEFVNPELNNYGFTFVVAGGSQATPSATHDKAVVSNIKPGEANATNVMAGLLKKVNVAYNTQGGSAVTTNRLVPGQSVATEPVSTKTNNKFLGWYDAATGGNKITFPYKTGLTDRTFFAHWQMLQFKLSFDDQQGNVKTSDVNTETIFPQPTPDPTKAGYTFAGWFTAKTGGTKWNFTTGKMPGNDLILYAQYTAANQTITFDSDGGTPKPADIVKPTGTTVAIDAAPSKAGYTLAGWYNGNTKVEGNISMPAGGMALKARWTANDQTIIFNANGGAPTPANIVAKTDTDVNIGAVTKPTKAGYAFDGWYNGATKIDGTIKMPAGGMTLVAKWTAQDQTIKFDTKGGTPQPSNIVQKTDTDVNIDAVIKPSKGGYKLLGWFNGNSLVQGTIKMPAGGMTLTAKYESEDQTITFDPDGGLPAPADIVKKTDEDVNIGAVAKPVKAGYEFTNWYNGPTKVDGTIKMPAGGMNLKAHYTALDQTITFDAKGGAPTPSNIVKPTGTDVNIGTITKPSKAGYSFDGWYNGITKIDGTIKMPAGGMKLEAKWDALNQTISFDAKGGAPTPDNIVKPTGENVNIDAVTKPALAGYKFDGWYNGATKVSGTIAMPANGMKLDAHYTAENQTITFDAKGGAPTPANIVKPTNSDVNIDDVATPSRVGYSFTGWYTTGGSKTEGIIKMPAGGMNLEAQWKAEDQTITFDAKGGAPTPNDIVQATNTDVDIDAAGSPSKTGYSFDGWYSGSTKISGTIKMPANGLKLVAQWKAEQQTITFDPNGGAPKPADIKEKTGEDVDIDAVSVPTRDGYAFAGWYNGSAKISGTIKMPATGLDLVANWNAEDQTITFDANGGAPTPKNIVQPTNSNVNIAAVSKPIKAGYTFLGWFNGSSKVDGTIKMPAGGMHLEADWKAEDQTIKFDTKGGLPQPGNIVQPTDSDVNIDAVVKPTKDGYKLTGWYHGATKVEGTIKMPAGGMTLEARYESQDQTITFDADGGLPQPADITKPTDTPINIDANQDPIKSGYTFLGWYKGSDKIYGTINMPAGGMHLVAKYKAEDQTITFDPNGGTPKPANIVKPTGTKIDISTVTKPSKAGYDFEGWYDSNSNKIDGTIDMPAGGMKLKAEYIALNQTISFDTKGGMPTPTDIIEPTNTDVDIDAVSEPSKAGYSFAGWYKADEKITGTIKMPVGGMKLVAKWTAENQTISFDAKGGVPTPNNIVLPTDTDVNIATVVMPSKAGYSFDGWYEGPSKVEGTIKMPVGGMHLEAHWKAELQTITFDPNGGAPKPADIKEATDEDVDIDGVAQPSKDGYAFDGWYNGSTKVSGTIKMPANGMKLVAKWTAVDQTITFDPNGGAPKPDDIVKPTETNIDINAVVQPTKAGYTFSGWYDGSSKISGTIKMPVGGLTLVAKWNADNQTITFDANGGAPTPANIVKVTDEDVNIDGVSKPSKDGYSFLGWYEGPSKIEGTIKMPVGGKHLVAQWTAEDQTIKFDTKGGSPQPANIVKPTGTLVDIDAVEKPSKDGYALIGWYVGSSKVEGVINMPAGGLTLTAKYESTEQTITFDADGGLPQPADITKPTDTPIYINAIQDPIKAGYKFIGWHKGSEKISGTINMPAGGMHLVAKYEALDQTITFDAKGGNPTPGNIVKPTGTDINIAAVQKPTKNGYSFDGWYNGTDRVDGTIQMPVNGMKLVAKWDALNQTITFDPDGGAPTPSNIVQETDSDVNISAVSEPTKDGYRFIGWYNISTNTRVDGTIKMPVNGMSLIARYTAVNQTITFDAKGGAPTPSNIVRPTETIVDIDGVVKPTKAGYEFDGWYNGSTKVSGSIAMPVGGMKLDAQWHAVDQTITFDPKGGAPKPTDIVKPTETIIDIDAVQKPIKDGYSFDGWYETNTKIEGTISMPAGGMKLAAKWVAVDQTITFDPNGGAPKPADIVKPTETIVDIDGVSQPTRDGYTFAGWYNGSSKVAGSIAMPANGLNLVAKWTANDQTITFDAKGGTPTPKNIVQPTNSDVNITAVKEPSKAGYDFDGWYDGTDLVSGTIKMPVGGKHLEAKWSAVDQTIKFDTKGGLPQPGNIVQPTDTDVDIDAVVKPSKDGYNLLGWYDGSTKVEGTIKMPAGGLTLVAKYESADQTITFDADGGTPQPANIVEPTDSDVDIDAVEKPARDGYTFIGWYKGSDKVSGTIKMPYGGRHLEAQWKAENQTIKFDTKGGAPKPANIVKPTDSDVDIDAVVEPTKAGYTFLGWYENGSKVSGTIKMPYGGRHLEAQWKAENQTIKFDTKGGLPQPSDIVEPTDSDVDIDAVVQPSKDGYNLIGWYNGSTKVEGTIKMPAGGMTLVAKYESQDQTITFDADGGLPQPADIVKPTDTPINLVAIQDPIKTGYKFKGWFNGSDQVSGEIKMPAGGMHLVAKYEALDQTIIFDAKGGAPTPANIVKPTGTDIDIDAVHEPIKDGYNFIGWYSGNDKVDGTIKMPAKGLKLDAHWQAVDQTITFDAKGGMPTPADIVEPTDTNVNIGAIQKPVKDGYTFLGWFNGNEQIKGIIKMPAGGMHLEAKWNNEDHTITFDPNKGAPKPANITQATDTDVNIDGVNQPTRDGYTFLGWFDGANQVSGTIKMPAGGLDLVAHWTSEDQTITFDAKGGAPTPADIVQATDSNVDLSVVVDPSKGGYTFLGWYNGSTKVEGTIKMPAGGMHLEAKYKTENQTITFDAKGGKPVPINIVQPTDSDVNIDGVVKPIKEGYTFLGWYDGSDKVEGTIKMPAGGKHLVADWKAEDQTIKFDTKGGLPQPADIVEPTDSDVDIDAVVKPSKDGYNLLGWYNGSTKVEGTIKMPAGGLTLTAKYESQDQTITFDADGGLPQPADIVKPTDTTINIGAIQDPIKTGYIFKGWFNGSDKVDREIKMPAGGMHLVAKYTATDQTIMFDAKGGAPTPANIVKPTGTDIDIEAVVKPSKDGYNFAGWYHGSDKVDGTIQMPVGGMKLEAKWDAVDQTITFDAKGGAPTPANIIEPTGTDIDIDGVSQPTKDGYTFSGWYNGSSKVSGTIKMPANGMLLEAKWNADDQAITFDAKGGAPTPANIVQATDSDVNIAAVEEPSKAGYSFDGWYDGTDLVSGTIQMPYGGKHLEAHWKAEDQTITFDTKGGLPQPADIVEPTNTDVDIDAVVKPSKDGYNLLGWYNGSTKVEGTIKMPAGGLTLTAKYESQDQTITFDANGGLPQPADIVKPTDTPINLVAIQDPIKTGYVFKGWFNGSDQVSGEIKMPAGGMHLVAEYTATDQTITFDAKGGAPTPANIVKPTGTDIDIAAVVEPTKAGYTFGGWYNKTELVSGTIKMPVGGMKLEAKWIAENQAITFDAKGGAPTPADIIEPSDSDVNIDAVIKPTKDGYTFSGWYNGSSKVAGTIKMPVGGMHLEAKWTAENQTITFDAKGGAPIPANIIRPTDSDVDIDAIEEPIKAGYSFEGWYDGTDLVSGTIKMPYGGKHLEAHWKAEDQTIKFDTKGGTPQPADIVEPTDSDVDIDAVEKPSKDGYKLLGWFNGSTKVEGTIKMPAGGLTLTAKYESQDQTITFDADGGLPQPNDIVKPTDTEINIQAIQNPIKAGYVFEGWYKNNTEKVSGTIKMPAGGMHLVAQYTAIDQTITFDAKGGAPTPANIVKPTETDIDIAALEQPIKAGYAFLGWYNGSDKVDGTIKMPVGGMHLVAKWESLDQTITFDAKGGTPTPTDIVKPTAEDVNIDTVEKPKKAGYTFLGWYKDGTTKTDGTIKMPAGGMHLEAKWRAEDQTITFDPKGGSPKPANIVEPTDSDVDIDLVTKPNIAGYTFLGWYDGTDQVSGVIKMPAGGLDLVAKYSADNQTITFDAKGGAPTPTDIVEPTDTQIDIDSVTEPTRAGYKFKGWYQGLDKIEGTIKMPVNGMHLDANWTALNQEITFDPNGGTLNDTSKINQPTDSKVEIGNINDPSRPGYQFEGWFNGTDKIEGTIKMPAGGMTLVAEWTALDQTITFDPDGGTPKPANIIEPTDTEVNIDAVTMPTKPNNKFIGWYDGFKKVDGKISMPAGGLKLRAGWKFEIFTGKNITGSVNKVNEINGDYIMNNSKPQILEETTINNIPVKELSIDTIDNSKRKAAVGSYPINYTTETGSIYTVYASLGKVKHPATNDTHALDSNDFTIELSELNKIKKSGNLEQKIIELGEIKAWQINNNKFVNNAKVDIQEARTINKAGKYKLYSSLETSSLRNQGMSISSKNSNISNDLTMTVIDKSNGGKGNNPGGNGPGGTGLPVTGSSNSGVIITSLLASLTTILGLAYRKIRRVE